MTRKILAVSFLSLAAVAVAAPALADSYEDSVTAQIRKNVEYPRLAKMREQEGTVGFTVKIDPTGGVQDVSVDAPSGNAALDNATVEAVKKSAPFATPSGGPRAVHGVVAFKL